jgi:hypothetical protein
VVAPSPASSPGAFQVFVRGTIPSSLRRVVGPLNCWPRVHRLENDRLPVFVSLYIAVLVSRPSSAVRACKLDLIRPRDHELLAQCQRGGLDEQQEESRAVGHSSSGKAVRKEMKTSRLSLGLGFSVGEAPNCQ